MSKSGRNYDFTLTASVGSVQRISALGTVCKVLTAPGGPVEIRTEAGSVYTLNEGQGFRAPEGFTELTIRNASGVAQAGSVFVGGDDFIDGRVSGTVQVVDGERNKVIAGYAYRGVVSQGGGGAGGALAQLMNPGASAKNLFVGAIRVGTSAADSWNLVSTSTQAPTLIGAGSNLDRGVGGAAASTRSGNDATAYAAQVTYALGYIAASTDLVMVLPKPILVRPGFGLFIQLNTAATNLRCTFEWEEWPI